MENRQYFVGSTIKADGDLYQIIGKITYMNKNDGKTWDEYRLQSVEYANEERWLSVDNYYKEYSLSRKNPHADTLGYHRVDDGIETVVAVSGSVDVVVGDTASFEEFEDAEEEKIVSIEHWDDGDEYSTGYYLDPWEFGAEGENTTAYRMKSGKTLGIFAAVVIWLLMILGPMISGALGSNKKIEKYVKKSSNYKYVTSITGNDKQKANVYEYVYSQAIVSDNMITDGQIDLVAKDIIDGIDGNTESVQQNNEDDDLSIAILTKKEYCIIYRGEDDKIYVQVSPRKYVYTSDKEPYHARRGTHRYYRRFYYSTGYSSDSSTYSGSPSSYSGYSDGTISYDSGNEFNSYSGTVRQQSVNSRSSDGGGLSSGK